MDIVQTETQSVNWRNQPNDYQRRAANTKARRQAAGRYARPTKAQQAAFAKTMRRDGTKSLTVEEMGLLATMPTLLPAQRAEFAAMAQDAIEKVVR